LPVTQDGDLEVSALNHCGEHIPDRTVGDADGGGDLRLRDARRKGDRICVLGEHNSDSWRAITEPAISRDLTEPTHLEIGGMIGATALYSGHLRDTLGIHD
jgi:hypothetical protein